MIADCKLATVEPLKAPRSRDAPTHMDTSSSYDHKSLDTEIRQLKELFFNLRPSSKANWTNICIDKRHDFKFWAHITHELGFNILKCVFSIGMPYEDQLAVTQYLVKSDFGDTLCTSTCYISTLRNEIAFHLLSGMIENRLPGSIRLILRGNGYQFFEARINQLLFTDGNFDVDAICHNINAINTLFPFLLEYKSVNLQNMCHRLLTSKLWKFIWKYVITQFDDENKGYDKLFTTFLDMTSTFLYGARGSGFLKKLHTTASAYFWGYMLELLTWNTNHKALCKLIVFTADVLLLSFADRCLNVIPEEIIDGLNAKMNNAIKKADSEIITTEKIIEKNHIKSYYSEMAYDFLKKMLLALSCENKEPNNKQIRKNIPLLYEISSLSMSTLTIPLISDNLFEVEPRKPKFGLSENKIFPRILPCFNDGCDRNFHIDTPQVHLDQELEFFYCPSCGIPSYCSEECYRQHWKFSHREICPYFQSFPTFAKYLPQENKTIVSTLENFSLSSAGSDGDWTLIF
ncbi:conserved hypothetical protein [Theileria equi strain WA]|uniref:MYND-type domain-containing protein n=1 Tax=Theileria equi strain WA TaxID=1537102 RepID=L1LDQ2_THEEQ|nr:conserved hypothetical protein [Theileria equi strain WA]EKX73404.1 conserved hypothetical protein [Theileria equi strain WA]|eukprot:XP_004832856.1 conserved hypothetical protein [Theileria equi strain WA]